MTTPPDDNGQDNGDKKLSATEAAIIEMMKRQNLEAEQHRLQEGSVAAIQQDSEKKHAFWNTQVCYLVRFHFFIVTLLNLESSESPSVLLLYFLRYV